MYDPMPELALPTDHYVKFRGEKRFIPTGQDPINWPRVSRENWHLIGGEVELKGVRGDGSDDDDDITEDLYDLMAFD
jgi:hypothetical protein